MVIHPALRDVRLTSGFESALLAPVGGSGTVPDLLALLIGVDTGVKVLTKVLRTRQRPPSRRVGGEGLWVLLNLALRVEAGNNPGLVLRQRDRQREVFGELLVEVVHPVRVAGVPVLPGLVDVELELLALSWPDANRSVGLEKYLRQVPVARAGLDFVRMLGRVIAQALVVPDHLHLHHGVECSSVVLILVLERPQGAHPSGHLLLDDVVVVDTIRAEELQDRVRLHLGREPWVRLRQLVYCVPLDGAVDRRKPPRVALEDHVERLGIESKPSLIGDVKELPELPGDEDVFLPGLRVFVGEASVLRNGRDLIRPLDQLRVVVEDRAPLLHGVFPGTEERGEILQRVAGVRHLRRVEQEVRHIALRQLRGVAPHPVDLVERDRLVVGVDSLDKSVLVHAGTATDVALCGHPLEVTTDVGVDVDAGTGQPATVGAVDLKLALHVVSERPVVDGVLAPKLFRLVAHRLEPLAPEVGVLLVDWAGDIGWRIAFAVNPHAVDGVLAAEPPFDVG